MQIKVTTYFVLFTCLVSSLMGKALYRKGCFECEEEEWEEVPCENIQSHVKTVTTSPTPIFKPTVRIPKTTTQRPSTREPRPLTTPALRAKSKTTDVSPESTTPKDIYKKCYCECKLGCKEFCRKVVVNPTEKQIVQVSKISEPVKKGRIETTHILQRELIPKSDQNYEPESESYSTSKVLPIPLQASFKGEPAIDPNVISENYNSESIVPAIEPIYGPYVISDAGAKSIDLFDSYPPVPQHSSYYNDPNSVDNYNFPIPFENVFSKVSKNLLNPVQNVQISLDATSGKDERPGITSVTDSPLETRVSSYSFDDSLATFLREVISRSPSNEETYQAYPYSVSYNR